LTGTQSLAMNAEVSGSKVVDVFCYQHQFMGQSSDAGAGISLVTDYASDFDAVALAAHHKSNCPHGHCGNERPGGCALVNAHINFPSEAKEVVLTSWINFCCWKSLGGQTGPAVLNTTSFMGRNQYIWSGPRPGGLTLRLRDSWGIEVRGWPPGAISVLTRLALGCL
jgi:hypothetical protein